MTKNSLTQARLKELLDYNPETGVLTWRVAPRRGMVFPGDRAGSVSPRLGYVLVGIEGKRLYGHRLAWLYMTGEWPKHEIDHRNLDRADNRWANLRPGSVSQNRANTGKRSHNTSGEKGVSWQAGKWVAQITHNKKAHYLGRFSSKEAAAEAYRQAAVRLHGEFARLE